MLRLSARGRHAALVGLALVGCAPGGMDTPRLRQRVLDRIAATPAEAVSVYFSPLDGGDPLLINADVRMHAAATMVLPMLVQVFQDVSDQRFRLTDSLLLANRFVSAADGSWYTLDAQRDTDPELHDRVGERVMIRDLLSLMAAASSPLAINTVLDLVGPARTTRTMWTVGADSVRVERGVMDFAAYERGYDNTLTARDLGILLTAVGQHRILSDAACREIVDLLTGGRFADGIPQGVPESARVAHKTGAIRGIEHDAAIVYPRRGPAYVLVVLTSGVTDPVDANRLIADLSRIVYEAVTGS